MIFPFDQTSWLLNKEIGSSSDSLCEDPEYLLILFVHCKLYGQFSSCTVCVQF